MKQNVEYPIKKSTATYTAYRILQVAFVAAPLLAGFDKFFNFLVNWEKYLSPAFAQIMNIGPTGMMRMVGVIEIIAAIIVAVRPKIGAYIVAIWLLVIIANLLMLKGYYDIALRDFGLMLGALSLGLLSDDYNP